MTLSIVGLVGILSELWATPRRTLKLMSRSDGLFLSSLVKIWPRLLRFIFGPLILFPSLHCVFFIKGALPFFHPPQHFIYSVEFFPLRDISFWSLPPLIRTGSSLAITLGLSFTFLLGGFT